MFFVRRTYCHTSPAARRHATINVPPLLDVLVFLFVQTNGYVDFCTNTDNPSPLQQERHRKKKLTSGFSSVPSKTKPDGSIVYGFERMHLYGMIGILITAGLTQKSRLSEHWGTGPHDDYPLVRSCMPRDLFMLFYSRFFHMAPTITPLHKDDPDYDSKHHCRYLHAVVFLASRGCCCCCCCCCSAESSILSPRVPTCSCIALR